MSHLRKIVKNYKVNKVEKWQKLVAGLNPKHTHIFKLRKKDVQCSIKIGVKFYKELRLQDSHCLYTFLESEVRKWQSSQSEKSDNYSKSPEGHEYPRPAPFLNV